MATARAVEATLSRRLLLALDGTGVGALVAASVAMSSSALGGLAAVAGASWALALLTIPSAALRPTGARVGLARVGVALGAVLNTFGSASLATEESGVAPVAIAVLIAGVAVSVGYLLLVPPQDRRG